MSQQFDFQIKGLKKVAIPVKQEQKLANLREDILEYLKDFYFYDEVNKKQITKFAQNRLSIKQLKDKLSIRFPSYEPDNHDEPIKPDDPNKGKVDESKECVIIDEKSSFKSIIHIRESFNLRQVRTLISIPSGYESFTFVKEDVEISQSSQQSTLVKMISKSVNSKTQVRINLKKIQKLQTEKKSKQESENKKKKAEETKAKVNEMIKQLDQFEKKYTKQGQQKNKAKKQKLKQISDTLASLDIVFNLESNIDIKQIISDLKKKEQQSQKLIQLLQSTANYDNINVLASKYFNTVGIGYRKKNLASSNVLDFQLCKFEEDNNFNKLVSNDFSYSSEQAQIKHLRTMQSRLIGGSFSAEGGNPFFYIKGGASYDTDHSQTKSIKTTQETEKVYKNFISLYIGIGIVLIQDNVFVKQYIINQYQNLLKAFLKDNNQEQFISMAEEFLLNYGDKIQIGTYYFGNTFTNNLQLTFQKKLSGFQSQYVAQQALATAIEAGGIFQGGSAAGKASFNMANSQGNQQSNQKLNSKYVMKSHTSSYPPVQNFSQWKQVVATKNVFWKIVGKDTQFVSIIKILRSKNTIRRSQYLQSANQEKFKEFQEALQRIADQSQKTKQISSRQFKGKNFKEICQQMAKLSQTQDIQSIIVKRTSSGIFESIKINHWQKYIYKARRKSRKHEIIKDNEVTLILQSVNFLLSLVSELQVSLERFKNLKVLTIYAKFFLFNSTKQSLFAQQMNKRGINVELYLPTAFLPLKKQQKNWTKDLGSKFTGIKQSNWD